MSKQYPSGIISKTPVTPSGPYENSAASGVWTLDQQAYWTELGQWPTAGNIPPDAQFNYVTMLLHGDGTNGAQNNTFLDSSSNALTITRGGNTTQGSFSPYGSNWSNYFDGSTDWFSVADNSALDFDAGDLTAEAWIYLSDATVVNTVVAKGFASAGGWMLWVQSTLRFRMYDASGSSITAISSASLTSNSWNHVAATRSGNTLTVYINGVSSGTATFSGTSTNSAALEIGAYNSGNGNLAGYISNLRLVKGTAVYTGNFTPSTTPLTAVSGTSLLTCQSNRFIDNSANNFTLTKTGDISVQRFNPFGASTAYSTSVIGGSGYFDGSGDYLSLSTQTFASDFTWETWYYATALGSSTGNYSMLMGELAIDNMQFAVRLDGSVTYYNGSSSSTLAAAGTVKTGTWYHFALVRNGSDTTLYVNGVATGTKTSDIGDRYIAVVGNIYPYSTAYSVTGYLSNVRLTTTPVYTSNFTPPTAPLTAVSGTQLLLLTTNGAIFDNAMMNDLETVGNAQISTSVVKYGTGSLAFDRTGDYIKIPPSTNMSFGTGDFTIECWVRFALNPVGNGQGMYQLTNGYLNNTIRGPACGVETSTGEWTIYYGTTYTQSGVVPTTGVWYHTAFVRYSGTTKLYVNGTSVISVADTANYTDQYFTIGGWYDTSFLLNGYIDDLRITKGYARYTANFTPPTAAFPNIGPT